MIFESHQIMQHCPLFISCLCVLGLAACKNQSAAITAFKPQASDTMRQHRECMVGYWYGDQPTTNGGRKQYFAHHAEDGVLTVTFKIQDSFGEKTEFLESGFWGLSGLYFATLIGDVGKGQNEFPPVQPSWNIYQIEKITSDNLQYHSVETGNRYKMRRVSSDFKMEGN